MEMKSEREKNGADRSLRLIQGEIEFNRGARKIQTNKQTNKPKQNKSGVLSIGGERTISVCVSFHNFSFFDPHFTEPQMFQMYIH
jgi:hypothetical protein